MSDPKIHVLRPYGENKTNREEADGAMMIVALLIVFIFGLALGAIVAWALS